MSDYEHAGTLVHGTHRPQDLIPAFLGKLDELAPEDRAVRIRELWPNLTRDPDLADSEEYGEAVPDLIFALFDALDELAPEGWYFGALEGDGSDFGFWRTEESILPPGQSVGTWSNDA